ncbi:hypothetical protein DEU38_112150 [Rhodococcus sp. AG1013]|nr:hypothetical protein DEU38_112150 [Rhodococcus sp. AG1013]
MAIPVLQPPTHRRVVWIRIRRQPRRHTGVGTAGPSEFPGHPMIMRSAPITPARRRTSRAPPRIRVPAVWPPFQMGVGKEHEHVEAVLFGEERDSHAGCGVASFSSSPDGVLGSELCISTIASADRIDRISLSYSDCRAAELLSAASISSSPDGVLGSELCISTIASADRIDRISLSYSDCRAAELLSAASMHSAVTNDDRTTIEFEPTGSRVRRRVGRRRSAPAWTHLTRVGPPLGRFRLRRNTSPQGGNRVGGPPRTRHRTQSRRPAIDDTRRNRESGQHQATRGRIFRGWSATASSSGWRAAVVADCSAR